MMLAVVSPWLEVTGAALTAWEGAGDFGVAAANDAEDVAGVAGPAGGKYCKGLL